MGRLYLFLAEGFEEIEALMVVDICRRAKLDLMTVSVTGELQVLGSHSIPVQADILFEDGDYSDLSMLILPGGGLGTQNLENHEPLMELMEQCAKEGKYISAICAAPRILGNHGLLQDEKACCYPGNEEFLLGAEVMHEPAVVSGNYITGRGMGCSMEFAFAIVERMAGSAVMEEVREKVMYPYGN